MNDPYFPENYPSYHDVYPTNKQVLYIASDHKSGVSNTKFCLGKLTLNDLTVNPTLNEIDTRLKHILTPQNIYTCSDGEIIEYDNKTLHRASESLNSGWRLLIKLVFYDKDVYEKVLKIGWFNNSQN